MSEEGESSGERCPSCKGQMETGHIGGRHALTWHSDTVRWRGRPELLSEYSFWGSLKVPALRCKKCRLVVFRYKKRLG